MSASTRSQTSVQQDLLETALARLQALEESQQQLAAENAALRQELDDRPVPRASPPFTSIKEPKVSSPDPFYGREKAKLPAFLLGLNIVFNTQASRYPDDVTKINYAISFLRDDAIAWVTPFTNKPVADQPGWLKNYEAFVEELKTMFGDPDEVATAERQIRVLRQRGPASAYFAEFRRLAAVLGWNDTALASQAYTGLKDSVKDELARIGRPTSLNLLIETATRLDNRLFERQTERERSGNASNRNVATTTQTTKNVISNPTGGKTLTTQVVKKEFVAAVGAPARRGPLTDTEKERRRREGLCLYCGQAGHALDTCPVAPRSNSSNNRPSAINSIQTQPVDTFSVPFKLLQDSPSLTISCPSLKNVSASVLLDSAATRNYIDVEFSHRHSLPLVALHQPISVQFADGSSGSELITHTTTLPINLPAGPSHQVLFFVTHLRSHQVYLGLPWFKERSALLDFDSNHLSYSLPQSGLLQSDAPSSTYIPGTQCPPFEEISLSPAERQDILDAQVPSPILVASPTQNQDPSAFPQPWLEYEPLAPLPYTALPSDAPASSGRTFLKPTVPMLSRLTRPLTSSRTTSILQATLRRKANSSSSVGQPNAQLIRHTVVDAEDAGIRKILPKIYHPFVDVFRKSSADQLPEHRHYDHKIPLMPDTTPPFGPIYSLSAKEHDVLREYIKENLEKGFIRPSSSPAGAPVLFVPKSSGELRLCVDYRGLNNVSIKDRYAIPKIDDLLDRIRGSTIFTKIDLRGAYNLLRIFEGDEWKTSFRTRYGSYEYLVMPFGLCNAPSSFQRFMNDVFRDMVDVFVVIYLDDILIFSSTPKEHERHVKTVLERLRSANLFAKAEKCEFSKDSVEFLGYQLSKDGVLMVNDKVQSVLSWPIPKSVKDIQSFLGFANFYRRFIWRYSHIVSPLTALTRKDIPWNWSQRCQEAFDALKSAFTSAPVLQHFDPAKPITLETDASDYAIAAVASQPDADGKLRPIAYRSRKMDPAELNYEIHDKEMLAIVDSFKDWRHLLQDSSHPVTVLTDHKNLEYFTTTKLLNRRQARWALLLSEYDFKVIYRPGHQGGKPDALTRRPDYHPGTATRHFADHNQHNNMVLLPESKHDFQTFDRHAVIRATFAVEPDLALRQRFIDAYAGDPLARKVLQTPLKDYSVKDDFIFHKHRVYVPDSLRVEVIKSRHDHLLAGHPGRRKTLSLIRRDYFWPAMRKTVEDYVDTCDACARTKVPRHKPYGLLKPLPIAERPWSDLSMDLIEGLPLSDKYDSILVIVCRFSKMALFVPVHSTMTAPDLAELYLKHVFAKHGLPKTIVSDRGSEFTSSFWRSLCQLLSIEQALSTAYHPQTDGQTERVNQNLEQYLRLFTNYQQDDWARLLPLAEFTYNNTEHSTIGVSPFFANKGFDPAFDLPPQGASEALTVHPDATGLAERISELHVYLKSQIAEANEASKIAYDRRHMDAPDYSVGDQVMLSTRHIRTTRPTKKLDYRLIGPFTISQKISSHAYRLDLPSSMRIHNVFHVSLLEPHKPNTLSGRTQDPPPPIEVDEDLHYEVERIVDSKIDRRYACHLRYLVEWSGYTGTDRYTWEGADQLNCPRHVQDFHNRHPNKPGPLAF